VPEVTDEVQARLDPELAVLSAMAHGQNADSGKAVRIALAAQLASLGLDEDRARLYFDLVLASLSEAARREPALVLRLLTRRFGALPPDAAERLGAASIDELDAIGERLLTAQSLDEALGPP
jgi:hypothetical protein